MASNALLAFLSQYISETFMDEVVNEIDTTGDISEATLKKAGIRKTSTLKFLKDNILIFHIAQQFLLRRHLNLKAQKDGYPFL